MTSFRSTTRRGALHLLAAGAASAALPAFAQWLDRPIKIVVTLPPGGASLAMPEVQQRLIDSASWASRKPWPCSTLS